ncbi:MAG: hypothetical protein N2Z67_07395 [Acetobacteraceae bacterium]|nr:hypothetical protein [Acetobacteraceae bacterium]
MSPDGGIPGPAPEIQGFLATAVLPTLAHLLDIPPTPPGWRSAAAALAARIEALPLHLAVQALRALDPRGERIEALCREVLLPAAARLRAAHDPEALDQSAYLLALWRLRMCLIALDDRAAASLAAPPPAGAVLTLDPHTLAPSLEHAVSARFLTRDGWAVHDCCCGGAEEGCDSLHDEPYDAVWLSLDSEIDLDLARSVAERLRRASRNRRIRLLGGGGQDLPEIPASALGLDALTRDALAAPRLARRLALA